MGQRPAEAVRQARRQQHDVVRPRRNEHHGGKQHKGEQQRMRHGWAHAIFGKARGRFDSSIRAMPPTTVIIPASRSGPKVSPKAMLDAAEPTKGTNSATGTPWGGV